MTYFLIHALDATSADEAQEMLDGAYAAGIDEVTIADDIVRPGEARLVGWPLWGDISAAYSGAGKGSILLAPVTILGTVMHLGAIRVDEDGEATGGPSVQADLDHVYALYETALSRTDIEGFDGEYVIYATPHGA